MSETSFDNLTDKELKWGYWFVSHKLLLKKIGLNLFVGAVVLLFLIIVWLTIDLFFITYSSYRTQMQSLVITPSSITQIRNYSAAQVTPLQTGETSIFFSQGKYDFLTPVANDNDKYVAYFQYRYRTVTGDTAWQKAFVLPKESKYLNFLAFESEQPVRTANLEIRDFSWTKVLNFDKLQKERLNFQVDQINYLQDGPDFKVNFIAQNNSGYSFRQVGFLVLLLQKDTLVGVGYVRLNDFLAGHQEDVSLVWYGENKNINKVTVLPEVDILSADSFLEVK